MNHNDNIPNGGVTKTSKVNYNNITPTTKAVKKVQNSVVSVINYKQQESRSDLSDFYSHFLVIREATLIRAYKFTVKALESSIKKMVKMPMLSLITTSLMGLNKLKFN